MISVIKHQTGFEHSHECQTVPDLTRGESSKLSDIMLDFHNFQCDQCHKTSNRIWTFTWVPDGSGYKQKRKFKVVWLSQTFSVISVIKPQTGFECSTFTWVPDGSGSNQNSKLYDIMLDFHEQFHSISLSWSLPSCSMRLGLQSVKSPKSALQMVRRVVWVWSTLHLKDGILTFTPSRFFGPPR